MKKFVFIAISAFFVIGCNIGDLEFDDVGAPPITGVFSFPLGEARYRMDSILSKQTGDSLGLTQDSTGLYTLAYFDTITYSANNDFVEIADIDTGSVITAPASPAGEARTVSFGNSFDFSYDPQGEETLEEVFYETGELTISTTSGLAGLLSYSYTVVNTTNVNTNNSVVLSGTIDGPGSDIQTQSLINHKTRLTGGANTFSIILNVSVNLSATDQLEGNEQIEFTIRYSDQTFNLVFGRFGQDTIQVGQQSIDLDFFSQSDREGITFGNPQMTFDFRNSFGLPVQVDFGGVIGDDGDGQVIPLSGSIVRSTPVIEGSDVTSPSANTPAEVTQTVIEINNTNSNIVQLLGSAPNSLVFDMEGLSNPDDANQLNFFQNTSEITAYVSMEIPMEIQLENLRETGTFDLDGIDIKEIDSAFIRVVTINELPFAAVVDLAIKDADSTTLYTVAENQIMVAPFISVTGEVNDPNGVTADIPLSPEGVDALAEASFVEITLILNTPPSQTSRDIYVKIRSDYEILVKVGIGGKLNLDL
ncbi:MAG: hypothetical protein HRT61_14835 [Ekhidna sp.]|nr:hypothetical protein [Ekhidna sp.]